MGRPIPIFGGVCGRSGYYREDVNRNKRMSVAFDALNQFVQAMSEDTGW
ncbi:hypothetical protein QFZ88_001404 [Mesorhizobium sp. YL-MeA3-2017]|jgi:hypothetical protein|nr:hypothetical protein [Mesorhizobium sp. YL-MeA3-2017]